eukprot:SAG31_NODE_45065_length_260_cov_0.645963_1_plen_55_part_01
MLNIGQMGLSLLLKSRLLQSFMYSSLLLWVADDDGITIVPANVDKRITFKTDQAK